MKYSYTWLGEYFDQPLPSPEELAQNITINAFEVETAEKAGEDTVLDIKVLPNRAHDALSHRGMAREVAALLGLPIKRVVKEDTAPDAHVPKVLINVTAGPLCPRYIGVRAEQITIQDSPEWLKAKLSLIGQRSINNIVDLTNLILLDLGQPMHAFDAAKVMGGITVRLARAGETMTTLDGKALEFDGSELVIADDEAVLALAGVKGGKKAEVDERTTAVIFECANFDAVSTRKTSTRHNIKTDASKRFENGMTSELAGEAIQRALVLLTKLMPDVKIGASTDVYVSPETEQSIVSASLSQINQLLGTEMTDSDVMGVLCRMGYAGFLFTTEGGQYAVTVPIERLDVRIKEDLIEEIGRLYGYDKIVPTLPKLARKGLPNKRLYYANKVRNFLAERGFSEVYTYSFAVKGEGEIEVMNPVGKDRPFMRKSLVPGIERALQSNFFNAPFLQIEDVKIFELGNIFDPKEEMRLCIGAMGGTKKRWKALLPELEVVLKELPALFDAQSFSEQIVSREQAGIIELHFDRLISGLPEATENELLVEGVGSVTYRTFSPYPFIVRDVALWVPPETKAEDIEGIIRANAGELAQKIYLFDTFEKEGRKSFAFRMVLQSFERTLEDAEASDVYNAVVQALRESNSAWDVRV